MKLSAYIEMLKGELECNGDFEVVITQSGYYSDGPEADIFDKPELREIKTRPEMVYVLGHSEQHY